MKTRAVVLALALSLSVPAAAAERLAVALTPPSARPGDIVLLRVTEAPVELQGEWGGRPLRFFPVPGGRAALVGVDLEAAVKPVAWRLYRPMAGGGRLVVAAGAFGVRPWSFGTQTLTLPPGQVDLDAATLARVRAEQAELRQVLASSASERLWRGGFRVPVEDGHPTGGFGLRRIINGQLRSPHAGYDWAAPRGTPIRPANAGRVALVAEHFFAGRLVVLDHGLGLFTLYFHLDDIRVETGDRVEVSQPLGSLGATGRVTGAHLHFAVSLDGARVDPMALLSLPLPPEGSPDGTPGRAATD